MSKASLLFAAPAADAPANIVAAARTLLPHLVRSRPLDRKLLSSVMEMCFNGSDADGAWSWRDAYDAVEAALALQIRRLGPQVGRVEDEVIGGESGVAEGERDERGQPMHLKAHADLLKGEKRRAPSPAPFLVAFDQNVTDQLLM